jgi:hypothetical protein
MALQRFLESLLSLEGNGASGLLPPRVLFGGIPLRARQPAGPPNRTPNEGANMSLLDDPRFALAERDAEERDLWNPKKNPEHPRRLIGVAAGWRRGVELQHGPVDILDLNDQTGRGWSVIVSTKVLVSKLDAGEVSAWSEDNQRMEVLRLLGPVQVDELVSIAYVGETDAAPSKSSYSKYRVDRWDAAGVKLTDPGAHRPAQPAGGVTVPPPPPPARASERPDQDIPFEMTV